MPLAQQIHQLVWQRQIRARGFGLERRDPALNEAASKLNGPVLQIEVLPLQSEDLAHSRPSYPAKATASFSRDSSRPSRRKNSAAVNCTECLVRLVEPRGQFDARLSHRIFVQVAPFHAEFERKLHHVPDGTHGFRRKALGILRRPHNERSQSSTAARTAGFSKSRTRYVSHRERTHLLMTSL